MSLCNYNLTKAGISLTSCKINRNLSFEHCLLFHAAQCVFTIALPGSVLKAIPFSSGVKLKSKRKYSIVVCVEKKLISLQKQLIKCSLEKENKFRKQKYEI